MLITDADRLMNQQLQPILLFAWKWPRTTASYTKAILPAQKSTGVNGMFNSMEIPLPPPPPLTETGHLKSKQYLQPIIFSIFYQQTTDQ